MNFWDSSAIIALVADEPAGPEARQTLEADPHMAVWWGTPVECVAAIARKERIGVAGAGQVAEGLRRLEDLAHDWHEVQPDRPLRLLARRLVRVHPLKAADALQLAAAVVVAEQEPAKIGFVSFDGQLNKAAALEGLAVLDGSPARPA